MKTARILWAICLLSLLVYVSPFLAWPDAHAQRKYGAVTGLYADENRSACGVSNPPGFFPFEMWVWWYPEEFHGMHAAEFMISYPSNAIASTVTQNPEITVSLGTLSTGVGVSFGACQSGWTWTHHQQCYLMNGSVPQPTCIQILPHPTSGYLQIADCTCGYPLWPAFALTHLYLNQSSSCPSLYEFLPRIVGVNITGATTIRVLFDMCVQHGSWIVPQHFVLHNKTAWTDSIKMLQATWMQDDAYDLVLQRAMADSTTYVLSAWRTYWSCSFEFSNESRFEFTFLKAIGTEETSWGAIKALFRE